MSERIITHPGRAHFDEFLAISLILATHVETAFIVERRDPTKTELADPRTWVVDIGERHQPELRNFDHHQDLSLGSSFILVADYLHLRETLHHYPWWNYKDRIDRFGPFQTAGEIGASSLIPTFSPFETWFLGLFERSPLLTTHIMQMFGRHLIDEGRKFRACFQYWKNCPTERIKGRLVLIGETDDATALQEFRDSMEEPAAVAVTLDRRGEGWRLYRFNDTPGVDFTRVADHPQILFAHRGGFIAKTRDRIPLPEALAIVAKALV